MVEGADTEAAGQKNNYNVSNKHWLPDKEKISSPPAAGRMIVRIINESITTVVGSLSSESFQFYIREETGIDTKDGEQLMEKADLFEKKLSDLLGFGAEAIFSKINPQLVQEFRLDRDMLMSKGMAGDNSLYNPGDFTKLLSLVSAT